MEHLFAITTGFLADESGVTAIEYGLLAALIAVAAIGGFSAVGGNVFAMYDEWSKAVVDALSGN